MLGLDFLSKLLKIIDDLCSLKSTHAIFIEKDFDEYKQDHSQRLLDNFLDVALTGISAAFLMRVVILESKNTILDLILPFIIFLLIAILYILNKRTTHLKHYFHMAVIPLVGLLTARKTISQNKEHFFLNESFASWLIMMMFGGFSSTMQWYSVVGINCICFGVYIAIVFMQYGFHGIGNDFYVHITTTIIFSATLIRMNEVNLRSSFNLLSCSKVQEQKWQRVLMMLTDGVLIMQHTENDHGILLINPSLQKIFKMNRDDQRSPDYVHENNFGGLINQSPLNMAEQSIENNLQMRSTASDNYRFASISVRGQGLSQKCTQGGQTVDNLSEGGTFNNQNGQSLERPSTSPNRMEQNPFVNKMSQNMQNFIHKKRFNERDVGPIFNQLFRTIRFKIVFSNPNDKHKQNRHSKEVQFLNDFICKQMEYFKADLPSGYSEKLFLKLLNPKRIIELNMVKLDDETQVLFLFKEVSTYNKLQKEKTSEKFANILINSIAHNLFTPLNQLIQLNKGMSNLVSRLNQSAAQSVQMVGICLQQLVFTTHNILEMSKIKQSKFKPNYKNVKVAEKLDYIFDFFKDDIRFREIEYEVKIQERLNNHLISVDDARLSIVLYNIISNSVKFTNGGQIKVSAKILDQNQMNMKMKKCQSQRRARRVNMKMNSGASGSSDEEDEGSQSSEDSKAQSSMMRKQYDDSDVQMFEDNENKSNLFLSISVSDTGIGMNEEMKKKCFLLFGNLKFKQDINQGGMGLGLASANLICKSLNGELNLIRSEENEGSKFQFTMAINKICSESISSENRSDEQASNQNEEEENHLQKIIQSINNDEQDECSERSDNYEQHTSQQSEEPKQKYTFRLKSKNVIFKQIHKHPQKSEASDHSSQFKIQSNQSIFDQEPKSRFRKSQSFVLETSSNRLSHQNRSDEKPDSFINFINKSDIITCYQMKNKMSVSHKQKNPFTQCNIAHNNTGIFYENSNLITIDQQTQNFKTQNVDANFEEFSDSYEGEDYYDEEEEDSQMPGHGEGSEYTYDLLSINKAQVTPKKVNSDIQKPENEIQVGNLTRMGISQNLMDYGDIGHMSQQPIESCSVSEGISNSQMIMLYDNDNEIKGKSNQSDPASQIIQNDKIEPGEFCGNRATQTFNENFDNTNMKFQAQSAEILRKQESDSKNSAQPKKQPYQIRQLIKNSARDCSLSIRSSCSKKNSKNRIITGSSFVNDSNSPQRGNTTNQIRSCERERSHFKPTVKTPSRNDLTPPNLRQEKSQSYDSSQKSFSQTIQHSSSKLSVKKGQSSISLQILEAPKTKNRKKKNFTTGSGARSNSVNHVFTEDYAPVLIVDDTVFNIMILQNIFLINHKIKTDQAISGEEAIMKCKQRITLGQEAYRLIVMDINMPGMDGVVATKKIREIFDPYVKKRGQKDYTIVAHTALPEEQFGDCTEKGFDAFMQKPIDNDLLIEYLKKVHLK